MYQGFYNQPPVWENLSRAVGWMLDRYAHLKSFPIGKSVLGREIMALSIGSPLGATVFVGAVHGLEWMTTLLLIRFAEALLEGLETGGSVSDIQVRKALHNRSLVVIPCLNPDGVAISVQGKAGALEKGDEAEAICSGDFSRWQANANGVDLNHNFDAGWRKLRQLEKERGIDGPAVARYGGPYPGSEAETEAVITFCRTYQPRSLYAFHTQGERIYYRCGRQTPMRSQLMAQILASSSGYEVARPAGSEVHGGLKNWFVGKLQRPGFTIEIGKGDEPLPIGDFSGIYPRLEEMLMIATLL